MMMNKPTGASWLELLVVDDDRRMRELLAEILQEHGFGVSSAADGEEALAALAAKNFDLVVTDLKMPGPDGLAILRQARAGNPEMPVIMITGHGSVDSALAAMKQGAYDYIEKPFDPEQLLLVVQRAAGYARLCRQNRELNSTLHDLRTEELIGSGPAMRKTKELLLRIAPFEVPVLLQGETGTGKELAARLIHRHSRRQEAPFLPLNCAAVPEGLLESELFGHEAGAFTGAGQRKQGLVEAADGGTLFLDEIDSMSPAFQGKMLRFLQDHSFMRVGGERQRQADVRILAASGRDLAAAAEEGSFRADLFYRLKGMLVTLPPLRRRSEDIAELAYYFLRKFNNLYQRQVTRIGRDALEMLLVYPWPGNVRELENVIGSAVIMAEQESITPAALPGELHDERNDEGAGESLNLQVMERRLIRRALAQTDGNKARAARLLGIDPATLWRKLKK
ncbi:MAG: sigma-54 dependent transcriptional regulator [Desulfurivibrio sp.]|nr:sigma-54 dependent transcriptional regulator [Desulfurivibrio sp.]